MRKKETSKWEHALSLSFCFIALGVLSGCVAGQSIRLDYSPSVVSKPVYSSQTAGVVVRDERPFVKDGTKSPDYLGHFRATAGNTWGVTTKGNVPLAELMEKDIREELTAAGLKTTSQNPSRKLMVDIVDYNFDSYLNAKMWYEVNIKVLDSAGNVLAENKIKETHVIKGSVMTGPKNAVMRETPIIYKKLITDIVHSGSILDALSQ